MNAAAGPPRAEGDDPAEAGTTLNVNIGVMGHVDSGKTSLVRALSSVLSTAALDKHPQSRQRGITLDLGFSAFALDAPPHVREARPGVTTVQYTLVDCPGHASLIRTIIGGAQIIDMIVLVVDAVKGVQTQTAECLVIGEVTTDNLVVVLNKVDLLLAREDGAALLEKATAKVRKALTATRFADAPIVPLSAAPGGAGKGGAGGKGEPGEGAASSAAAEAAARADVSALVASLRDRVTVPHRTSAGPLFMAVDHCFQMRGLGTVMTGTVLRGRLAVGDEVEVPSVGERRRVKSIQMFRRDVRSIGHGDRAGFAVTSLAGGKLERAVVCAPGSVSAVRVAVALVRRIRYFKGEVASARTKVHVTVGHSTVMATAVFFGAQEIAERLAAAPEAAASGAGAAAAAAASSSASSGAATGAPRDAAMAGGTAPPALPFSWDDSYAWQDALEAKVRLPAGPGEAKGASVKAPWQWALLELDAPVFCPDDTTVIGSRLDADESSPTCRLAFAGRLVHVVTPAGMAAVAAARGVDAAALSSASAPPDALTAAARRCLRVYRTKERAGAVDRVASGDAAAGTGCEVILRGLCTKDSDVSRFVGLRVVCDGGAEGTISGGFGKSGKLRARLSGAAVAAGERVSLPMRKYVFDTDKRTVRQE